MFTIKKFDELTLDEFYEIAKSRYEIFACEQHIFEVNDFDDDDRVSYHVFMKSGNRVCAYLRIIPQEFSHYKYTALGRVLVLKDFRRKGLAEKMVNASVKFINDELGEKHASLSAQSYIAGLYKKCGFNAVSDEYLEAGIPHIEMEI